MKNLWNKKWPRVLLVVLICGVLALAVDATGGKLAQPERKAVEEDKFIGYQLVFERLPGEWEEITRDYSGWVDYGPDYVKVDGLGTVAFSKKILIGEYDEAKSRYVFPGREGFNCFCAVQDLEGGKHYTGYTDMADVHTKVGDMETSVSGTVYFGPPVDATSWNTENYDYGWTAYPVYQMKDGTVYLEDGGNSYGGIGGFTVSTKTAYTETVDGEEQTTSFEVSVSMESVERVREFSVTWFDGANQQVMEHTIPMEEIGEEGLTLERPQRAVWVLVSETDRLGAVKRSAYTLGEEGASHRLVRLDERGMGRVTYLTLK
ncbi:hypothetical protein ACTQ4E_05200 [Lawsonibacter sp. LCP25S3_G6]|uniref:hypothetical protein n=1 Tax=unclassified Lawsonibacter TaxID=2617946 RepID=UPI003F980467